MEVRPADKASYLWKMRGNPHCDHLRIEQEYKAGYEWGTYCVRCGQRNPKTKTNRSKTMGEYGVLGLFGLIGLGLFVWPELNAKAARSSGPWRIIGGVAVVVALVGLFAT